MAQWTPAEQKEHRAAWVAALRSGKYQQGDNYLHQGETFCCLGVACEISGLSKWRGDTLPFYLGEARFLPEQVRDWLGLGGRLGSFNGSSDDRKVYLSDLNDGGKPFSEIANIIEAEPAGLLAASAKAA